MSIMDVIKKARAAAAVIVAAEVEKNRDIAGAKTGDHANGERRGNGDVWWNGSWHTQADYNALIVPVTAFAPPAVAMVPGGVLQNIQQLTESAVTLSQAAEEQFLYRANNAATQEEQDAIVADWQERENMAARAASRKRVAATTKIQKIAFGVTAGIITAGAISAVSGLATSTAGGAAAKEVVDKAVAVKEKADEIKDTLDADKNKIVAMLPDTSKLPISGGKDYLKEITDSVDAVISRPPGIMPPPATADAAAPAAAEVDFLQQFFNWLAKVVKG